MPSAVPGYEDSWHLSDLAFLRLAGPFTLARASHCPVFLYDAIVAAVLRCRSLACWRGVAITTDLLQTRNRDAGVEVLGDRILLEAMVENVVNNALRASPQGSSVQLDVQVRGDAIALLVRHDVTVNHESALGGLMAPPQVRRTAANGLDLAIARLVAERHHGTVAFHNRADGSSEFEIDLPRWRSEGPAALQWS
jgi:signal transduction histidine kinase